MTPALRTDGLGRQFGGIRAVNNVSLEFRKGERHAIIGPNGAGKTTLVNLLTGVLRPTEGDVFLDGHVVTRLRPDERVKRGLARTFQINSLFPELTVLQSVLLAVCERHGVAIKAWRKLERCAGEISSAREILEGLNLRAIENEPVRELAYGQQRLVEIALALACRPRVLLLDEPAAGVPRGESEALFRAIAGLPGGVTVVFIEHDMDLVFRFAQRITVLVQGSVLVQGEPREIAADPEVKRVYLGSAA
jgi:branched-chain amino acid transport system ATP-binding protein